MGKGKKIEIGVGISLFAILLVTTLISNYAFEDVDEKEIEEKTISKPRTDLVVYRAFMTDISIISYNEVTSDVITLPDKLVIPTGRYNFFDTTFNLTEEGLYRLVLPGVKNEQRIVYEKNLDSFLSSIAWIYSHGNTDDSKNYNQIKQKAKTSKIFSTCGSISSTLMQMLSDIGVKSRLVQGLTLDDWNNYDNGHTLLEVYREDYGKWVVYDLDGNVYFVKDDVPLSLLEFADSVFTEDYEIIYLADDTSIDISNFKSGSFSYEFISEKVFANEKSLREWYKRVIHVPIIWEGKRGYFFDETDPDRVESYLTKYEFLEEDAFMKKFYDEI